MRDFAPRVLEWFDRYGRHDLPWQHPRTPYRVWLSEVMLQQTQVATVIPYFGRFVESLPHLRALAAAPDDQVLALWSGLGYYSRARNLHRAAQICVELHDSQLPDTLEELRTLPGIGRSTAGAILALAFDFRAPILDGNVRRVLIRHRGIEGDPLSPAVQSRLWALSEELMPSARVADYTQAIMDIGATVCMRAQPRCPPCPLRTDCIAAGTGRTAQLPTPRRRPARSRRECHALIVRDGNGRILLERRPASGVWGGLWSIPEFRDRATLQSSLSHALDPATEGFTGAPLATGLAPIRYRRSARRSDMPAVVGATPVATGTSYWPAQSAPLALPAIRHTFTHFDLTLSPTLIDLDREICSVSELDSPRWFAAHELCGIGLPAPIRKLLNRLPEPADVP